MTDSMTFGRTFARSLLSGACVTALAVAALPTVASAQVKEAPAPTAKSDTAVDENSADTPGNEKEVVVTGIRAGLKSAIDIKRRETGIVEAVSAEEIGKLPDQSIAESIARLPGLAAQRVNGRAQVISLRGLSPDFTTTLLNGRQQASSGDNRAVEFDQYPSELLNSVVIYKTPDANISGFGLAGSADLRTVRPLSYGKRAIAMNLRGEMVDGDKLNPDVSNRGLRGSFSYIDQITPTLGLALGVAYLDSPSQNRHFKGYNYETFCCGQQNRITPVASQNATFLTGQEIFAYSRNNKRLATMAIGEWKPNDVMHLTADLYYSRFKQRETMRGAQWFSNVWADAQTFSNVGVETFGGTRLATSGTDNGVAPQLRSDYNTRDDHLFSVGLNNESRINDRLSLVTDLSYSRNKRDESITETYMGYGCCATAATQNANRTFDSIGWVVPGDGFPTYTPGLNYADASRVSLGDRAPWGGWGHDGATKSPHVKEKVISTDSGLHYEADDGGVFESFDVGLNMTNRTKSKTVDEFDLMLKNGRKQVLVDPNLVVGEANLGFTGFGGVLAYDIPTAVGQYYDQLPLADANHFDKAWDITERVITARARATFGAGSFHGNLGLQIVGQKQTSTGARINFLVKPSVITQVTEEEDYVDLLPSLNSYFDLGGGQRIRFAAAKVLARPRMDEMRANLTPSFNTNPCGGGAASGASCQPGGTVRPWSASGGNPHLEPWRATALDVSYEYYLGAASYFAVAGFYKKLENYIYTRVNAFDFSVFPQPAIKIPAGVTVSPIGTVTQPDNGPGGNLWGLELSGALELKRITPMLDGFGVIGSASFSKSSLNPTDKTNAVVRIPGLSGTVANFTGYFERDGFQARASYRYRSPFKGEVVQLFANRGFTEILADRQVDAQVGYTFQPTSPLRNLGVLLQVSNLTDAPYRTRLGLDNGGVKTGTGETFLETYEKYGRQFLFGFSYKL